MGGGMDVEREGVEREDEMVWYGVGCRCIRSLICAVEFHVMNISYLTSSLYPPEQFIGREVVQCHHRRVQRGGEMVGSMGPVAETPSHHHHCRTAWKNCEL